MTYLLVIQSFWSSQYNTLDNVHLMKISSFLLDYNLKLKTFRVIDHNISRTGKDFAKLFIRKLFNSIIEVIENILKSEREIKAIQSSKNSHLTTYGPHDLFSVIMKARDLIKNNKHQYIHIQMLKIIHQSIIQYLIGVDCVISNDQLEVDYDFLIAIGNNTINLFDKVNQLIDDWEMLKVLNRTEINDAICLKNIISALNLMRINSIKRLVKELSCLLVDVINRNKCFTEVDMEKIMIETRELYGKYSTKMNAMVEKKFYEEIMKVTLSSYIRLLLITGQKKVKNVKEIMVLLEKDRDILKESYKNVVGNNLTDTTLKIIDDIKDFLDIRVELIGTSCFAIREFIGPSFTLGTAILLINLRSDLSLEDKKEASVICQNVINNHKDKGQGMGYMNNLYISKKEYDQYDSERQSDNNIEQIEQKEDKFIKTRELTLEEFLQDNNNMLGNHSNKIKESYTDSIPKQEGIMSDIRYEGYMRKKSSSLWSERFFQLKNGYLYWYNDSKSNQCEKKISINSILKINSYKEKRFIMIIQEKKETIDGKVYKFELKTTEEKEAWLTAIQKEMKQLKHQITTSNNILLEINAKQRKVIDYYNLPDINKARINCKNRIIQSINEESFFKHFIDNDQIPKEKEQFNLDDIPKITHSKMQCSCVKTVVKKMTSYLYNDKCDSKEYLNQ